MCMLLGMSKQLVYAFPGFYNKETICSNNFIIVDILRYGLWVMIRHFFPFINLISSNFFYFSYSLDLFLYTVGKF